MLLIPLFLIAATTAQQVTINVPSKMNGIAYAPLRDNKDCVTRDNIFEDISLLSRATDSIRTYSTGCKHVDHIIAACAQYNLKLYVGLDVSEDDAKFTTQLSQLMSAIDANSNSDLSATLLGVVVGNENVFRKEITIEKLISLVGETRNALGPLGASIGRAIQISAAEIFINYLKNPELIDAVDFLVPNMYHPAL
jgi:exo-beta-1,3-glucanase (GH17 family)